MTSKLVLYNEALGHLESGALTSLSEDVAPRHVLDTYYAGAQKFCLEQGFWNFAMRTIQIDKSTSATPTFGYSNSFEKPTDWIRTYQVSASEVFNPPLLDFVDEPNFWYANVDPMYVRYVSNDSAYGLDLSIWPETFAEYFALYLAYKACIRITSDQSKKKDLKVLSREARGDARSKDAMNEPPAFRPMDTWASSRGQSAGRRSRWDGQVNG